MTLNNLNINNNLKFCVISHDLNLCDFECFINSVSSDFNPAFLTYVDLQTYYKKIKDNADIVGCYDKSNLVGLAIFYCNNQETKEAYAAFLAIKKEYRGFHIATNLMKSIIDISRNKGMKIIKLRTNNPFALDCYKKLEYEIYDEVFEKENNLTRYYLKRQL